MNTFNKNLPFCLASQPLFFSSSNPATYHLPQIAAPNLSLTEHQQNKWWVWFLPKTSQHQILKYRRHCFSHHSYLVCSAEQVAQGKVSAEPGTTLHMFPEISCICRRSSGQLGLHRTSRCFRQHLNSYRGSNKVSTWQSQSREVDRNMVQFSWGQYQCATCSCHLSSSKFQYSCLVIGFWKKLSVLPAATF